MSFTHSKQFHPPALIVPVQVCGPLRVERLAVDAKIDTGSDRTCIPDAIVNRLRLVSYGWIEAKGAFDPYGRVRETFFISILLPNGRAFDVEVISVPRGYALLGRDVLNECVLTASGPEQAFDLD